MTNWNSYVAFCSKSLDVASKLGHICHVIKFDLLVIIHVFKKDLTGKVLLNFDECTNEMEDIFWNKKDKINILNNMNIFKSASPDMILPRILKEAR